MGVVDGMRRIRRVSSGFRRKPARTARGALRAPILLGLAMLLATACGRAAVPKAAPALDPAIVNQKNGSTYTRTELQSVDPGAPLQGAPAPGFTLADQFGRRVSLSQFRGKVVVLSFDDDQCTTICPLTTATLVETLGLLGPAAGHVQLLGVNANPDHTAVKDVATFSRQHGMMNRWLFLTGPKAALEKVWKAYNIEDAVVKGAVDHTPAVYLLDEQGHERRLYLTSSDYGVVPLEAETLAHAIARILPGTPPVAAAGSPAGGPIASPAQSVSLPALEPGGKPVSLGGTGPRLVVFFASWAPDAARQLPALSRYAAAAQAAHLPVPVAVDVGSVEPSIAQARHLSPVRHGTLGFPLAVDVSGRVADAYGVQDIPWIALADHGRIVWSHDGWLAPAALEHAVKKALASG